MSNIFRDIGLFVTVMGAGIVVYVIARYRDMELTEDPGGLQFSNLKNIPGEDIVDLNVVKVGKTRTLGSYSASGSIKWEAFFNPSSSEDMERRKPAAVALVAAYGVFAVMAAVMKLMGVPAGYYFSVALLVLLSVLVVYKFVVHGVLRR